MQPSGTPDPASAVPAPPGGGRIVPLSRERHARWRWRRHDTYRFAANRWFATLTLAEVPVLATETPIAFLRAGTVMLTVAVLGLVHDRNLFVTEEGRWLGRYVPASVRAHPFLLGRTPRGDDAVCIDTASPYVISQGAEGEPFFDDQGGPSPETAKVLDFLTKLAGQQRQVLAASAALDRLGCLRPLPWPPGEKARPIGLFQAAQEALDKLPDAAFLELRRLGALPLVYQHLLSLQHVPVLERLAKAHSIHDAARRTGGVPQRAEGGLVLSESGGSLNFSNLR